MMRSLWGTASDPDVNLSEAHTFGWQSIPASRPADLSDFVPEPDRLRRAYGDACLAQFRDGQPNGGTLARSAVHQVDVADKATSYEFHGAALLRRTLERALG